MDEVNAALLITQSNIFMIIFKFFIAHANMHVVMQKNVIGRHADPDLKANGN